MKTSKSAPTRQASTPPAGFGRAGTSSPCARPNLGTEWLKQQHGETFARHYQSAWNAASGLAGKEFLEHYRALKRCAKQQGMSEERFQRFERCLYRRFYQAAVQDGLEKNRADREPKVRPHELAYIAKVAGISALEQKRDALVQEHGEHLGRINSLLAQSQGPAPRSSKLAY